MVATPTCTQMTVNRRKVPRGIVARAEALLASYNECARRDLRAYTASGEPSERLKTIVRRLVDHPEVSDDALRQAIRNVLANPPSWVEGKPDVGDIFGPNAFGRALANDGVKREPLTAAAAANQRKRQRVQRLVDAGRASEARA